MAALFPNLRTLPPRPPTNRESSPSQPPVSALTLSPDPASVDAIIVPSASQARPLISAGSPGDFSNRNLLSEGEEHDLKALIESKNIRPLPYPFGSGVAVVSDIDNSSRAQYEAYVGTLVDELGLDFGDSTWLRWQCSRGAANAFGFFSPHLAIGGLEARKSFDNTRTFNESVAEFHKGNVDHFHAFSSRGPRVVLIDRFDLSNDGYVEIEFDGFQDQGPWRCDDVFVFGVCVVGRPGKPVAVRSVTVREREGIVNDTYRATPYDAPPNGREHRLFTIRNSADDEATVPQLDKVHTITVEFHEPGHAANVERVMLISVFGEILIERLNYLGERFNVEMNLVTEHSGLHFRNPSRSRVVDPMLKKHIEEFRGPTETYNGSLVDDEGNLVFSTDADNPYSFCRVFPDISTDQELRFIVPHAAVRASGWDALQLVTPSPTRAGGGVYWAQRTSPNINQPLQGRWFDGHTRQDTFAGRVSRVLEETAREPGLLWPIYTHLGSLAGQPMPQPYFEPGPLRALQDRVFDISGDAASAGSRLWFTRATVLYDYALMMRGVADHVRRPDPDTAHIRSWTDPVLGKTLPRSPAQLYGLTFYVEDAWKARVSLDGRPIRRLVRNPGDESGRPSVTIAEADIRYVLFDRLDPAANDAGMEPLGGDWAWISSAEAEKGFGRLTVAAREGPAGRSEDARASLRAPLRGWAPTGAQLAAFSVRPEKGARWGFFFKTRSGGGFYFGDETLAGHVKGRTTASYFFPPIEVAGGDWGVFVAPFHDLAWAKDSAPGGPMPSHPMRAVTILCAGPAGSSVSIDNVEFLRPRTLARGEESNPGWCLGGHLPDFEPGATVQAAAVGATGVPPLTATVDQLGYFCFGLAPGGIYKVWSSSAAGEAYDRRGPLVEVGANFMGLVLKRRSGGEAD